jgi:hypothetical protein
MGPILGFITVKSATKETVSLYGSHENISKLLVDYVGRSGSFSTFSVDYPLAISCDSSLAASSSLPPTLTITASMQYTASLSHSDHEKSPSLHIFLSTNHSHDDPIVIMDPESRTSISLSFNLSCNTITDHTSLNFEQYALYINDNDNWCLSPAGSNSIQLSQLILNPSPVREIKLVYRNSSTKTVKATLVLSDIKVNFSASVSPLIVRNAAESEKVYSDAFNAACSTCDKYIQRNIEFYDSHPVTTEAIQNVTVFCDKRRKGFFPGSMFDVFRVPKTPVEFYLRLLDISVQRRLMKVSSKTDLAGADFCAHPSDSHKLYCVMNMLNLYNNYCEYITDFFDHNCARKSRCWRKDHYELTDSFDPIEHRGCGDCEDFAAFILRLVSDLLIHVNTNASAIITEILKVLNRYTFTSVLCGVSTSAITGSSSERAKTSKLKSHECVFAIPTEDMLKAIANYNPHDPIISVLSAEKHKKLKCDHIIPLEGTGILMVEPKGLSEADKEFTSYVKAANPDLIHARPTYSYDPSSENNFFKIMSTAIIPAFFVLYGKNNIEYIFAYREKTPGTKPSRGVWFPHLMNIDSHPDVLLIPSPSLTPDVIAAFNLIKKDDYPRVALKPMLFCADHVKIKTILSSTSKMPPLERLSSPVARFYYDFDQLDEQKALQLKHSLEEKGYSFVTRIEGIAQRSHHKKYHGGYALLVFRV